MEQSEAERLAGILREAGFVVGAARSAHHRGEWEVRADRSLAGWSSQDRFPVHWRHAIEKYFEQHNVVQAETTGEGMTKQQAGRYAAALRARTGNLSIRAVLDISTGNEDNWGVEDASATYWEYDQFPEEYKREIQACLVISNGRSSEEVTVTLTRVQAGVAAGLLSAEMYAAGTGEYADLLSDVARRLGQALIGGLDS